MATAANNFSKAAREAFLAHLAETANVTASAKAGGVPASRAYRERRQSAPFRLAWQKALTEGYARLEADLLAEALRSASGNLKDITLKSRALKIRLGMTLLSLHRASVRGGKSSALAPSKETPQERRGRWAARFDVMHDRLTEDATDAQ